MLRAGRRGPDEGVSSSCGGRQLRQVTVPESWEGAEPGRQSRLGRGERRQMGPEPAAGRAELFAC